MYRSTSFYEANNIITTTTRLKNRILPSTYPTHNPFRLLKVNHSPDLYSNHFFIFFISLSDKCSFLSTGLVLFPTLP